MIIVSNNVNNEKMTLKIKELMKLLKKGVEITMGKEIKKWTNSKEKYHRICNFEFFACNIVIL